MGFWSNLFGGKKGDDEEKKEEVMENVENSENTETSGAEDMNIDGENMDSESNSLESTEEQM